MGGLDKKILAYLKKNSDSEAIDIAFGLKTDDEHAVQTALDALGQSGQITSWRNGHGKVFWSLAGSGEARKQTVKQPAVGEVFDEFVLENEAVNIATETIAATIDTFVPPQPVPPPIPAPPPIQHPMSAPIPPATAEFILTPPPPRTPLMPPPVQRPAPAAAPIPTPIPRPAHAPAAAPRPAPAAPAASAGVDFEPKAKPAKEKAVKGDDDGDIGEKKPCSCGKLAAAMLAGFVILLALIFTTGVKQSSVDATVEAATASIRDQVTALKSDNETKTAELEKKIADLEAKVTVLEGTVKKLSETPKPAPQKAPAKRRR